ncbi:unnamed protein product [Acidithrix sp. C25]|nr:unnamed protein product [Acidithrix sp. C25]
MGIFVIGFKSISQLVRSYHNAALSWNQGVDWVHGPRCQGE